MQIEGNLSEINYMNVIYVKKPSEGALILFCRREFIEERQITNVRIVRKPLVTIIHIIDMGDFKMKRNSSNNFKAQEHFVYSHHQNVHEILH